MDLVAAARHGDEPDDDRYSAKQLVESAALVLARQVQVTKSQEKELSVVGLLCFVSGAFRFYFIIPIMKDCFSLFPTFDYLAVKSYPLCLVPMPESTSIANGEVPV